MKIPKSEESTLLVALVDCLREAKVTRFNTLRLPSDWEDETRSVLSQEFCKSLYEKLDDGGLTSLIQRHVLSKFLEIEYEWEKKEDSRSLNYFDLFSDTMNLSKSILSEIEDIPNEYTIYMNCYQSFTDDFNLEDLEIKIDDRFKIVSGSLISESIITSTGNEKRDNLYSASHFRDSNDGFLSDDGLYFQYNTSGFISDRTSPKLLRRFYDDVRAFYGACLAFGFMTKLSMDLYGNPIRTVVNTKIAKGQFYRYLEYTESDVTEASNKAYISPKKLSELNNEEFNILFSPVRRLFNSEDCQRLKTACIWLFRAHMNSRGMDKILDATIAIEVLLGDRDSSDRIGLAKLMANRCAYSLGKSSKERKSLFDFFLDFYKLRSEIVHSGRLDISKSENQRVERGIALAARLIRHEVEISTSGSA